MLGQQWWQLLYSIYILPEKISVYFTIGVMVQIYSYSEQLDSRLLCNAMGHPGWPQSTNYNTPGMHF